MKDRILDVAAEKIKLYGLKKFTIDEIAEELRISKKSIYKHYTSKDQIISEFFSVVIESDKDSVINALEYENSLQNKLHAIIYSTHKYMIPVKTLNEAKRFYPEEWLKLQELKSFKLKIMVDLLEKEASSGVIRKDINFQLLCKMLEGISDTFLDYDFLVNNKMTTNEAIDEVIKIIFHGILLN